MALNSGVMMIDDRLIGSAVSRDGFLAVVTYFCIIDSPIDL